MSGLFRDLSPEEEKEFRQWARDNYKAGDSISGVWHPTVQDECRIINQEILGNPEYVKNIAHSAGIDPAVFSQ